MPDSSDAASIPSAVSGVSTPISAMTQGVPGKPAFGLSGVGCRAMTAIPLVEDVDRRRPRLRLIKFVAQAARLCRVKSSLKVFRVAGSGAQAVSIAAFPADKFLMAGLMDK